MVYEGCTVGNIYVGSKDGRYRVYLKYEDRRTQVISYPKYLMEKHLNRYLLDTESVDHIDRDVSNNSLDNLRVLDRSVHSKLDAKRNEEVHSECLYCTNKVTLVGRKLSKAIQNRKEGKAGPFCSRKCSGKYGAEIQNGKRKKIIATQIIPTVTTLKKKLKGSKNKQ